MNRNQTPARKCKSTGSLRFIFAVAICSIAILSNAAADRAGETILLAARQLRAKQFEIQVPTAGRYWAWIWLKPDAAVPVRLGETRLGTARAQESTKPFDWAKLGSVDLEAAKNYRLRLGADDRETSEALKDKVGFVLLSRSADCKPERLFDIARVFDKSADAVKDARISELRHKDKTYTMPPYTKEEWVRRARQVRQHILIANGLWPLPEKTPLNAHRFGRLDRDGYSIEKVYFESYPGFFCTGNLYLPRGRKPPYPAMLCPHGHWKEGRLADEKSGSVVARCISFARQGYVVFSPDMVGYNDSKQVRHRRSSFADPLWGLSLMGLQTWNNIRGIDFLLSIKGVDPNRVGCTGASGGGTQTFILAAADDRVKCAVPVCMVSAHFQGGCECENAPLLRLDIFNVEIAAAAAPRPYMLTGATGDWTKNLMTVEGPAMRTIYKLLGAEDKFNYAIVDAGHNYNKETREHVYRWMGKWLLGETDAEKLREQPYTPEKPEDMLVFTPQHPLPAGALDEKGVHDMLVDATRKQLESLKPKDKAGLKKFRDSYRTQLRHTFLKPEMVPTGQTGPTRLTGQTGPTRLTGQTGPTGPTTVRSKSSVRAEAKTWTAEKIVLSDPSVGSQIPTIIFSPKNRDTVGAVVVVHPGGQMPLMDIESGGPGLLVSALLERGYAVLTPDCFLTGEHHSPFVETVRALPRDFPYTYNPTTLACRVRDIVTVCGCARMQLAGTIASGSRKQPKTHLVGVGTAGPWCLLAAALDEGISSVAVDANQLNDKDEASWQGDMFQPNILRCGGLRVAGALIAPRRLLIHNTDGKLDTDWITDVYGLTAAKKSVQIEPSALPYPEIVSWLSGR